MIGTAIFLLDQSLYYRNVIIAVTGNIKDDLEYNDSENECEVFDNEREKPSSDESEVADEIF